MLTTDRPQAAAGPPRAGAARSDPGATGHRRRRAGRLHRRQAQLRRAPTRRDRADLFGRRGHPARSRHPAAAAAGRRSRGVRARRRQRQGDAHAGHELQVRGARAGEPSAAPARDRHGAVRPVRRPRARADGLPADHPRARQGRARAHQGHLGPVAQEGAQPRIQRAVRRRRGGHVLRRQAVEPDQRPEALRAQGDRRVRQGWRAGGDRLRQQAAHRHVPPGVHGGADARDDRIPGRRNPIQPARRRSAGRNRPRRHAPRARRDARRTASNCAPTTSCWRWATARATRSRCCMRAACSSKPNRSRSASASNIRNR